MSQAPSGAGRPPLPTKSQRRCPAPVVCGELQPALVPLPATWLLNFIADMDWPRRGGSLDRPGERAGCAGSGLSQGCAQKQGAPLNGLLSFPRFEPYEGNSSI